MENNTQLEAVPSEPILETDLSNLDTKFNNVDIKVNKKVSKKNISNEDTNNSIRSIQMSKLEEISNFKPDLSNSSQQNVTEQEQELHDLARQLKNLDNIEKVLSNSMSSVGASNFIRNGAIAYIPANSTATEIVSLTQQAQLSFSVPEKELKNASTLKISIDGGATHTFNIFWPVSICTNIRIVAYWFRIKRLFY